MPGQPGVMSDKKRIMKANICFSLFGEQRALMHPSSKNNRHSSSLDTDFVGSPLLPGLSDDVAKRCLALVPRYHLVTMGAVCRKWRSFIKSKEFIMERKLVGMLDEHLYVLTMDGEGKESRWEVFNCLGQKHQTLPAMPGPAKAGFGVAVVNGKLLVIAGYSLDDGTAVASADVYQYDSCLNRCVPFSSLYVCCDHLMLFYF